MGEIVTQGIVLRTVNYRDHDRILTIFTPGSGCVDALSRGCKRPKSRLLSCSELFACGEFTLFQGRERIVVTGCELQDHFYPLRLDPHRLCCAVYMGALAQTAAPPNEEAAELYALLLKGLYILAYDSMADDLSSMSAFLLIFADLNGYRPRLMHCVHCRKPLDLRGDAFLDGEAGGLCCPDCVSSSCFRLSHDQIVWMSRTLREQKLRQEACVSKEFFRILQNYVERRIETNSKAGQMLP